jgi:hypothetical protein
LRESPLKNKIINMDILPEELAAHSVNEPILATPVQSIGEKLESLEWSLIKNINNLSYGFFIDETDETESWFDFGVGGPA